VARTITDVSQAAEFLHNPYLPLTRSETALPLKVRGQVIGVLDVQSAEAATLTEEDVTVLATLADQVATAIENARSFERLAALAEENQRLLANSERAVEELSALTRRLTTEAWEKYLTGQHGELVVEDVSPQLTTTDNESARFDPLLESARPSTASNPQTVFSLPILLRGEQIGTIDLEPAESNQSWEAENTAIIKSVAERVGLALDNARLFEEARIRADELTVLNELSQNLNARLDVDQVLAQVHIGLSRLIDTTNFYIGLYDPVAHTVSFPVNITESAADRKISAISADQGLTGYILRTRTSLLLKNDVREWEEKMGVEPVGQSAQSWLGVPMLTGGQIIGVMAIENYETPNSYDEHDRDLLAAFANQTAVAIQNARLFEQTQRDADRERAINRIAARLRNAQSVEQVLSIATQEVRAATRASISIAEIAPLAQPIGDQPQSDNGHTARSEA
jgi:GAF domain-containing protein